MATGHHGVSGQLAHALVMEERRNVTVCASKHSLVDDLVLGTQQRWLHVAWSLVLVSQGGNVMWIVCPRLGGSVTWIIWREHDVDCLSLRENVMGIILSLGGNVVWIV